MSIPGAAENPAFGLLLVDKPQGPTSHDVVSWIRWALRERSVGHCGTLDPAATGLLVVCVGAATRLVERFTGADKSYEAVFALGRSTDTLDATGQTIARSPVDADAVPRALKIIERWPTLGEQQLAPPAFSALKVDGRRAHELARAGQQVDLALRPMTVLSAEEIVCLTHVCSEEVLVSARLRVSKGSYIRSLAQSLADELGLPCHLHALRRVAAGEQSLDDIETVAGISVAQLPAISGRPDKFRLSWPQANLSRDAMGLALRERLRSPWPVLGMPVVSAVQGPARAALERFLHGQRLSPSSDAMRAIEAQVAAADGGSQGRHGGLVLVDEGAARAVIIEREVPAGGGLRWAPKRVLRWQGVHGKS